MNKKEIRMMMKEREQIFLSVPDASAAASASIVSALESEDSFRDAGFILAYMAIPGEVSLHQAFGRWIRDGKRVALPVVEGENLVLREYVPAEMHPGYKGILEPGPGAPEVQPSEVELALVPGVAFTADGGRLGRGKGFYDRLLPQLDCTKIGLCFRYRMLPGLPVDPWDARLDKVITD